MPASNSQSAVPDATKFDTRAVPVAARLDFWNRVNTETFSEISVDPRSDSLRGVLERRQQGLLKLARVHSTPVVLQGGRGISQTHRSAGLLLHLQEAGSSLHCQLNHSSVLRVGDIGFFDAGRPYTVKCSNPVEIAVIKIPADLIAQRFDSIDPFVGLYVDGTRGAGAILAAVIRSLWRHYGELDSDGSATGEALISSVLDLMAVLPHTDRDPLVASNSATLCREMRTYIEDRLTDASLSVSSVAEAFGLTPRHVHRVFATFETTPSAYLRDCRLSLAAARLRDARTNANITQIAFDSGFSDCTGFARAFRRKYGVAPRDFRREHRT
jgi:AraC-like DNA-binding protein